MSAHTKGPWVVEFRNDHSAYISLGDSRSGPHKQFDLEFDDRDPSDVADARLISAAPDLLEALDLITSLASQEWQEPDGSRKGATDNQGRRMWFISADVMQEARAAILKATGEEA